MARLAAHKLVFRYPDEEHPVLDGFTWTFPDQGFVGVLGPNGCGKSTLLALLSGAFVPVKGKVEVDGVPTTKYRGESALAQHVSFVFQNMEFETDETVRELVAQVAAANPLPDRPDPLALLAEFGVDHVADKSIQKISKGELQLVILCFALVSSPRILLLDEPTFALKREEALRALDRVREHAGRLGMLVVFTSHDLECMERYSENVILFRRDGSLEIGPAAEVLSHDNIERAFGVPYALLKLPMSTGLAMENRGKQPVEPAPPTAGPPVP